MCRYYRPLLSSLHELRRTAADGYHTFHHTCFYSPVTLASVVLMPPLHAMSSIKQASENAQVLKAATQEPRVYLRRWAEFGLAGSISYVQVGRFCNQSSDTVPNRSRIKKKKKQWAI